MKVIIKINIAANSVQKFLENAREMVEKSSAEPDCLSYEIFQGIDSTNFLIYEEFRSQTALDSHKETEHYIRFSESISSLLTIEPKIEII